MVARLGYLNGISACLRSLSLPRTLYFRSWPLSPSIVSYSCHDGTPLGTNWGGSEWSALRCRRGRQLEVFALELEISWGEPPLRIAADTHTVLPRSLNTAPQGRRDRQRELAGISLNNPDGSPLQYHRLKVHTFWFSPRKSVSRLS